MTNCPYCNESLTNHDYTRCAFLCAKEVFMAYIQLQQAQLAYEVATKKLVGAQTWKETQIKVMLNNS